MKEEHSPGPWRFALFDHEPNTAFVQWGAGYCEVHGARGRREINARLIAAAPELLDALSGIVSYWDSIIPTDCINEMHIKARAAIAKATGATND